MLSFSPNTCELTSKRPLWGAEKFFRFCFVFVFGVSKTIIYSFYLLDSVLGTYYILFIPRHHCEIQVVFSFYGIKILRLNYLPRFTQLMLEELRFDPHICLFLEPRLFLLHYVHLEKT